MGIDLNLIPESYLYSSSKASNTYRLITIAQNKIASMIKETSWSDISFKIGPASGNNTKFLVQLPIYIIEQIKEYREDLLKLEILDKVLGNWEQLLDDNPVYMETESDSKLHRSHFPNNGIPEFLRGTGLGYKLYRQLLETNTFLRSDSSGTENKNKVWASIVKHRGTEDDVHTIVGPSSVFAMIRSITKDKKIELVTKYLQTYIDLDSIHKNNFLIDDELESLLPNQLKNITRNPSAKAYLISEAKLIQESNRQAELIRLNQINQALYLQFGVSHVDTDWKIGDFIVNFKLLDTDPSAKIRIVVNYSGIKALSITDYIKLSITGKIPDNTVYRLPNTEDWTKIDILSIPDTSNVRLTITEEAFLKSIIFRGINRIDISNRDSNIIENLSDNGYGPIIVNHMTAEYKTDLVNRSIPIEYKNKITQGNFVSKIFLSSIQLDRLNDRQSTEVFIGFNRSKNKLRSIIDYNTEFQALNTMTGFITAKKYHLAQLTPKTLVDINPNRDSLTGQMVYIANDPLYFGIIAKVSSVIKTRDGIQYAMLSIFNPNLGGDFRKKISIRTSLLRKII